MHKRQKSIIHKKGNLEFYRRLSHYSTLVNIFHHDGFPKRRKQQLDSFHSPRKIEPLLPLFTKKRRKDFVIISTHHFQIAFSHPMFAGWVTTSLASKEKNSQIEGKRNQQLHRLWPFSFQYSFPPFHWLLWMTHHWPVITNNAWMRHVKL